VTNPAALELTRHPGAPTSPRAIGTQLRSLPPWLWIVSIALQVCSAAALTSYTFFLQDDFIFIAQARTMPFGIGYLRDGLFQHFSPVSRLLDKLLVVAAPGSWAFAHALQLGMYAAVLAAFVLVVQVVIGNSWTAFVMSILFGQSLFLMRMLNWWTASANIMPATLGLLFAIAGYLLWRRAHAWWWLALSLFGLLLALLDYETGMLIPVFLLLIFMVLEEQFSPRAWMTGLWRERSAWVGYGVLELLALANYLFYYYQPMPQPSVSQLAHFLEIGLFEAFIPALLGIKHPELALGRQPVVIVGAILIVGAGVAVVLYQRPRAWRCLAGFIVAFLLSMVSLGLNRIRLEGLSVANELYYQQSAQVMFFVFAALALSSAAPRTRRLPVVGLGRRGPLQNRGGLVATLIVALLAVYGAFYVDSVQVMVDNSPLPGFTRAYADAFTAGVAEVRHRTGHDPSLIDWYVPWGVLASAFFPFNLYDYFTLVLDKRVPINQPGASYVLDSQGRPREVHLVRPSIGELAMARQTGLDGSTIGPARGPRGAACLPNHGGVSRISIPLSASLTSTGPGGDPPYAIRLTVRTPVRTAILLLLEHGGVIAAGAATPQRFGPGRVTEVVPLTVGTAISKVILQLPAGSCVYSLKVGALAFTQRA
jgi:hypothetical protein